MWNPWLVYQLCLNHWLTSWIHHFHHQPEILDNDNNWYPNILNITLSNQKQNYVQNLKRIRHKIEITGPASLNLMTVFTLTTAWNDAPSWGTQGKTSLDGYIWSLLKMSNGWLPLITGVIVCFLPSYKTVNRSAQSKNQNNS